ncbi:MAG TPA: hypothetical protein VJ828_04840, partial [Lacipirellulaceae bacterium]|nr:hypothetical protein [Lacipirellulaceae bacterium]
MTLRQTKSRIALAVLAITFAYFRGVLTAHAGLRSAILTAYDGIEQSHDSRIFVTPRAGNDVPLDLSMGPKLIYEPASGQLSAQIPAVVVHNARFFDGTSQYTKLYSLSSATIGSEVVSLEAPFLNGTAYAWRNGIGSLYQIHPDIESAEVNCCLSCDASLVCDSIPPVWPLIGRTVAASINFGQILPPKLSHAELQLLTQDGTLAAFVDYANHRGVVTLRVPMLLHVVPEPGAALLVLA